MTRSSVAGSLRAQTEFCFPSESPAELVLGSPFPRLKSRDSLPPHIAGHFCKLDQVLAHSSVRAGVVVSPSPCS